ncbi:mannitol dehydrogenase family protein [Halomonas sp. HP20-15]|uniref:mannitol dehydrogenase family protein n=1 Tax=Halomonas sp. HP20-15 TaxID=3085901 RepID=UPI00298291EB|nr:mannitol dehydrogenase family protein [Halomonas sp. HP20-15]MDW5377117.1 mannitol dehydrogenase family protein [Halomonas sp. HP20-15]
MTQVTTLASDYAAAPVGIVHIGLGAFHRAHQAVFVERNLARHGGGEWGIASANIRSNQRLVDLLRDRNQRYHVAEYTDSRTLTVREIGAIREALYAGGHGADRETLLARMSDPKVRIVTLTVTEKGYYLSPAEGTLMVGDPAIAHDIAQPHAPRTAPGLLVEALARRQAAGVAPFTVLCCDNMPDNGNRTRQAVVELARERDPALADWIAESVAFPCSMVDRIVPAMTEADFARLRELGVDDPAAVICEAFAQWVVEDDFPQGRPDWEHEGVEMVADVAPFETMKLRMLNGSHSLLAYLGALDGVETVFDAVSRTDFSALLRHYMRQEAAATLAMPEGTDLKAYADSLLARFGNDSLRHRLHQIAMDGSQKIPQRWLQGAQIRLEADGDIACTALGVAAWIRYTAGSDLHGHRHAVDDPLAGTFAALHDRHGDSQESLVGAFLAEEAVFPPALASDARFSQAVLAAYRSLQAQGVTATLAALNDGQD